MLQVEVESLEQLREALDAGAQLILLDNFDLPAMREAVKIAGERAELEASGGMTLGKRARHRRDRRAPHLHRLPHQGRGGARPVDARSSTGIRSLPTLGKNSMRSFHALAVVLVLAGCATTGRQSRDPWEGLNRKTFAFNDALDRAVIKPVAQGYQKVTPAFAQEGVNNFYRTSRTWARCLNNFLQGKPGEGASDAGTLRREHGASASSGSGTWPRPWASRSTTRTSGRPSACGACRRGPTS